uniref:Intraflagellar transport protein 20 n=1 Tax=Spongospora subterranea TaxID=70186 RepID=A0A0H5RCV0_9EUKA|eukprot:CRZ12100.1 hypothetical protein [Spongospora subterranea]
MAMATETGQMNSSSPHDIAPKSVISFDEQNRIRIMNSTQFDQIQRISQESSQFTAKIGSFNGTISEIAQIMQNEGQKIEQQKLLAIGLRNRAESAGDIRRKHEHKLQAMIVHRQAELDRYLVQVASLEKVQQQQRFLLDKLAKPQ